MKEQCQKKKVQHKFKFKETLCVKNENVADAFEALIEMQNVEYRKKRIIQTMRSGELTRSRTRFYTSSTLNKGKENEIIRYNSTIYFEDKNKESNQKAGTIKIKGDKHKKIKKIIKIIKINVIVEYLKNRDYFKKLFIIQYLLI